MKYPSYKKELDALLQSKIIVDVNDFVTIFGNMPMTSVYARIRGMVKEGTLSVIGKGRYVACEKPQYRIVLSDWMKQCNAVMVKELVGVSSCMTERNGNLEIEVGKDDRQAVLETLSRHFEKVMLWDDVKYLKAPPKGCILVGRLVTESPVFFEDGVGLPAPEKILVDAIRRKEYSDKGITFLAAAIGDDKPAIKRCYGEDSFLDITDLKAFPMTIAKIIGGYALG